MYNISIVIPVYNQHGWMVKDAINSCLYQIGNINTEIILVDDGTNTPIKWYDEINIKHNRIKFFKLDKNKGVAKAWDFGIKQASYNWICPMACDDFFHPDKLEIQLTYMKYFNINFSYTGYREQFLDTNNNILQIRIHNVYNTPNNDGKLIFNKLIEGDYCNNFINGASVLMSKDIYHNIGGYDYNLRYQQDYDLWLRISNQYKILGVPFSLMTRRIHKNQAKIYFSGNPKLNEKYRRNIEYAIIKLKWENTILPVTKLGIDKEILKQEGYL